MIAAETQFKGLQVCRSTMVPPKPPNVRIDAVCAHMVHPPALPRL